MRGDLVSIVELASATRAACFSVGRQRSRGRAAAQDGDLARV